MTFVEDTATVRNGVGTATLFATVDAAPRPGRAARFGGVTEA